MGEHAHFRPVLLSIGSLRVLHFYKKQKKNRLNKHEIYLFHERNVYGKIRTVYDKVVRTQNPIGMGHWAYLLLQVVRPCCNATLATFCVFYRWQDRSGGIYTC